MIDEIKNKQNEILLKSEEDETKRIFIEAILSLLTTGVISLDVKYNINLINKSALKMLQRNYDELKIICSKCNNSNYIFLYKIL